jgi:NADP-dependent 3-hydroxy acid dehydrogenase YdfG
MKKVIVTGHSKGIGKAISNYFEQQGYVVSGFSRSTGYDISDETHRQKILAELADADIFVNNAYKNFDSSQLELLKSAFNLWQGSPKLIINISSRAGGAMNSPYAATKLEQDKFCSQHSFHLPRIINLKPGLVDTTRVSKIPGNRLTTDQLVEILDFILKNPIKIQSMTFGA